MVRVSPEAERVAVVPRSVSKMSEPEVTALKMPTFAIVTGNESLPFVVNVFEMVYVLVPVVWAYVPAARMRPPLAVVISPVSVVLLAEAAVEFAVRPTHLATAVAEAEPAT